MKIYQKTFSVIIILTIFLSFAACSNSDKALTLEEETLVKQYLGETPIYVYEGIDEYFQTPLYLLATIEISDYKLLGTYKPDLEKDIIIVVAETGFVAYYSINSADSLIITGNATLLRTIIIRNQDDLNRYLYKCTSLNQNGFSYEIIEDETSIIFEQEQKVAQIEKSFPTFDEIELSPEEQAIIDKYSDYIGNQPLYVYENGTGHFLSVNPNLPGRKLCGRYIFNENDLIVLVEDPEKIMGLCSLLDVKKFESEYGFTFIGINTFESPYFIDVQTHIFEFAD